MPRHTAFRSKKLHPCSFDPLSATAVKKVGQPAVAELRPEYRRSDFGTLVGGKYVERLRERSNVVVIDPRVAEFFPNPASVNAALLSLAEIARRAPRSAARVTRARRKRRAG